MTDVLPPPMRSEERRGEPAAGPARGPGAGQVGSTALAAAAAIVGGLVARFALGVRNPLVTVAVAYAVFLLVTLVRSEEVGRWRASLPSAPPRTDAAVAPEPAPGWAPDPVQGKTTDDEPDRRDVPGFTRAPATVTVPVGRATPDLVPGQVDEDPDHDEPRTVRTLAENDLWQAGAALAAGLAVAGTLRVVLGWSGIMSTSLWVYLAFAIVYFALVWDRSGQEIASDRIVTVLVWTTGALVLGGLLWMLGLLVVKGTPKLRPSFFTSDLSQTGPNDPGGGALHAIVGTLEQVGIAVVVVVPIAILTAVYLHELKGRLAPVIRFVVDAMSGLPSIVAGLLVFTIWVDGRGFSGVAGSGALVILMLPTVTRTSEEILRTVPDTLREASLALGAPEWRVVLRVVVPTAMSGLLTATILGVARAVGETAPMLLTSFGSDSTVTNPTSGPQSDLPLFVWKLIRVPNETQNQRAWTGALVLVLLVLVLFVSARLVASRARKRLGRAR